MPTDKSGKFHINPQVARMHDSQQGDSDGDQPKKKHFEAHKNDDGSVHSVAHNEDGTTDERDGDVEDAKQHLHEHMQDEPYDYPDDDGVDVKAADDGAY